MNWLNDLLQNDPESHRDPRVDRIAQGGHRPRRRRARAPAAREHGRAHPPRRRAPAVPPTTEYINTIPAHLEAKSPGDAAMEWRIRSIIRWNAMAMVVRANRKPGDLGGHIASFASAATLYDVGFNHFWRAPSADHPGDLLYIQGHSSPGIYARSFLEGRISETQLDNFRMEVDGRGISSYPHPWLMPDYWQTPTVSRWAWARSPRSTRRATGSTSKAAA